MAINKPKQALGENPLSKSIFTPTETEETKKLPKQEKKKQDKEDSSFKKEESRKKNQELLAEQFSFLNETEKEKVNLRLPTELNDWLDDLIKSGKRRHGHKIPKEIWMQAALELLRALSDDWAEVSSPEDLKVALEALVQKVDKS